GIGVRPELLHDPVARNDLVRVHEQERKQRTRPWAAERKRRAAGPDDQRAEDLELHFEGTLSGSSHDGAVPNQEVTAMTTITTPRAGSTAWQPKAGYTAWQPKAGAVAWATPKSGASAWQPKAGFSSWTSPK